MTRITRNNASNATPTTKSNRVNASNERKRVTKSNETPSIVLKTIHNDIMKSNAHATITTKKMRVWLRTNMRDVHAHNDAWIFTTSQYDIVRAQFDATYRAKIERDAKRATKSNDAPKRVRAKRVAKSNDDAPVVDTNAPATIDA